MKFKKIIYARKFEGLPKETDFDIVEEDLEDDLRENEFFYQALYVSPDPYLRLQAQTYVPGETTIPGYQLSKVVKSKNLKYPIGSILLMGTGWRTGGKSNGSDVWYERNDMPKNVPLTAGCGIFAMTGLTAYYGVHYVMNSKAGETLLVSAAAGAVGTIVGQIGKILGCRVIGSCGSDEKVEFVKSVGFDDAFNYKTETVDDALKRIAPNGVDCYFDNVGGDFATQVMQCMNRRGRIAVCGSVSAYNAQGPVKALLVQPIMFIKSLKMEGFNIFYDVPAVADESYQALRKWAEEGKVKQYESVTEGFKNLPCVFIGQLTGTNFGKALVKVQPET